VTPQSRVVYVDNDPIVLADARPLLSSSPEGATTSALDAVATIWQKAVYWRAEPG
jgi:hypothetical protein